MSIKQKVIALLAVLACLYLLPTIIIVRAVLLPAFSSIEREFAEQNADRVNQYINSELERVDSFVIDWAQWTETRDYIAGTNPNYIETNLGADAATLINVDVIAFFDNDINLIWGGVFDFGNADQLPIENFFELPFGKIPELFGHVDVTSSAAGLFNGPGPTLLLAARPVVDNDLAGPLVGTLVLGRVLDDRFLQDMQENLSLSSAFSHVGSGSSQPQDEDLMQVFDSDISNIFIEEESRTRMITGYRDIYGEPALIVEVDSRRDILEIGESTVDTGITLLIATLLLFILAIWYLLGRLILQPLSQLKEHIHKLQEDEDLSQHIDLSRADEFGEMAREFNELISKLNKSKEESETARLAAISASQAKSDFLATMSHEIRTPMNGVLGVADLLLATDSLSAEQRNYVNTINHSGGSLLKILNNILDFSKIEAGKFLLEDTEFNLIQALEDAAELLTFEIQNKGLEFVLDLSPRLSCEFVGDVGRVRQIVLNLLSNAAKFTTEGFICLRAFEGKDETGDFVQVEVEDSGVGIKEENQPRLFQSFTQEDASTTRKFGGTGLGLAVTKQLAELMGGEAGLESTFGEGSKFWIKVPLKRSENQGRSYDALLDQTAAIVLSSKTRSVDVLSKHLNFLGVDMTLLSGVEDFQRLDTGFLAKHKEGEIPLFVDEALTGEAFNDCFRMLVEKAAPQKLAVFLLTSRLKPTPDSLVKRLDIQGVLHHPVSFVKLITCLEKPAGRKTTQLVPEPLAELAQLPEKELNVLLVEDNEVNQLVAKNMLKKLDCNVTIATNGKEAVEVCSKTDFDIVFMDCSMPEMDGYEATQVIRKEEGERGASPVRIVALTANAMEEDRQRCLEAGMDDFLPKPVSLKSISEKLSAMELN
ncbi:MAG: response regulator [Pseudohongiellaceae bacterium]